MNPDNLLATAERCFIDNDHTQGLLVCTNLIELEPNNARALAIRAWCRAQLLIDHPESDGFSAEIEGIHSDADKSLNLCRRDALALSVLAWCFRIKDEFESAITILTEAIEFEPTRLPLYANRGVAYSCAALHERAISDYTTAIEMSPVPMDLFRLRGQSYAKLNKHEHAVLDFTEELRLFPDAANVYHDRAESYLAIDQYDLAISDCTTFLAMSPENASAYSLRGVCLGAQEHYDSAIRDFSEAIRIDPSDVQFFICRAVAFFFLREYNLCIADCESAISLDPTRAEPHHFQGECYAMMGDAEKASLAHRKAINLNPWVVESLLSFKKSNSWSSDSDS